MGGMTKVPTAWNAVPIANQYKSSVFGMKALPYVGYLSKKVDTAVPYASMVLKTAPYQPQYDEAAMKLDKSSGSFLMGLKAAPYIANTANSIVTKVDNRFTTWATR